jgi:hypothetical protein
MFKCKVFTYTSYNKNNDHTITICHVDNGRYYWFLGGVFCILLINFESCCAVVQQHDTRLNVYVVTVDQHSANPQAILGVFQNQDGNAYQTHALDSDQPWTSMDVHSDLWLLDYYLWDTLTFTTKCEYKCYIEVLFPN